MQFSLVNGCVSCGLFLKGQRQRMSGPGAPALFEGVGGIDAQPQTFGNMGIVADAGGKIHCVPLGAEGRIVEANHDFLLGAVHNGTRLKFFGGGKFQIAPRQKHHRHRRMTQTLGNAHTGRIAAGGAAPHAETLVIHFYSNGISYFFVLLCVRNKHIGRFSLIFGNRRKCHD